jgi:copper chaperone CopZ
MGCPDAVRAGIMALPGVQEVSYDPGQDVFEVQYNEERLALPVIFAAVHQAGRKMGKEYLPELLSRE